MTKMEALGLLLFALIAPAAWSIISTKMERRYWLHTFYTTSRDVLEETRLFGILWSLYHQAVELRALAALEVRIQQAGNDDANRGIEYLMKNGKETWTFKVGQAKLFIDLSIPHWSNARDWEELKVSRLGINDLVPFVPA